MPDSDSYETVQRPAENEHVNKSVKNQDIHSLSLPRGEGQGEGSHSIEYKDKGEGKVQYKEQKTVHCPPSAVLPKSGSPGRIRPTFPTRKSPLENRKFPLPTPSISFYHHTLDLRRPTPDLLAGMDAATRRGMRKAEKSGVRIEFANSVEAMRDYYALHCQTRRRHGLPPQPWEFFRNIQRRILAEGLGHVVLAKLENKSIAGAVFFHLDSQALYKFGASDRAHQSYRANNLIMGSTIQHYANEGFACLDFGRTALGNEGLRRFKRNFGASETMIPYFKHDFVGNRYMLEKDLATGWHNSIFRWMPLWGSRMVGNLLYKHLA